jgi:hypothetical protein
MNIMVATAIKHTTDLKAVEFVKNITAIKAIVDLPDITFIPATIL